MCEVTTSYYERRDRTERFRILSLPHRRRCTLSFDMHERGVLAPMET